MTTLQARTPAATHHERYVNARLAWFLAQVFPQPTYDGRRREENATASQLAITERVQGRRDPWSPPHSHAGGAE